MVSIFTHRDERRVFALIGAVIVAALIALLQLDSLRSGRTSPLTTAVSSIVTWFQLAAATVTDVTRNGVMNVGNLPQLARDNAAMREQISRLQTDNDALTETLARVPAERDLARAQLRIPAGIAATVIGYDPEATQRVITIDRGSTAHVSRDDGVMTGDGVIGRVVEVAPFSSKVLLITDPTSRLPAVVQHGRWWAIATGTLTRVKLQFVSQDAKLHVGDRVITGEGRSFHAGILIGRISAVVPNAAGSLDQSATIDPAVNLSAISRVLVVAK